MYHNPLEPRIPDHFGIKRLNLSQGTLESIEGVYLTDSWRIAADFAMGQSIENYVPAFMERFHKTSIPISHPMLQLPDNAARLEEFLQRHKFKSHKRWDDERYDYSDFGVLVPLVFELDVSGLPLHLDSEVELSLNISYFLFRMHCMAADPTKIYLKKKLITYEKARELTIGKGLLHQLLRRRETVEGILQMLAPKFLQPLRALEDILGEDYARAWFATSALDETPFPDGFIEATGMFYTDVAISFDRVVSISSMTLPHEIADYTKESQVTPQMLYHGPQAAKTLYHGTTIVSSLLAFPEIEELLQIPLELKEHWYELQLQRQVDEDLNFDPSGFFG